MISDDLPKAYDPKITDSKWYAFWEENGFFKADPHSSKPPYCIVIPPPNVTGVLHMGHALVNTLQDILIRWKRMSGYEALWVPGTDHAGIATQSVVEKNLLSTQGKRRDDFSREAFLKLVWEWKEKSEQTILKQLKKLGASCDWSRLRFTMDEGCCRAVRTMFKKLYDAGLIYRGNYLVNWDPITKTALADDEVEYEERDSFLWYFKYPLSDGSGYIRIATTRPETILGDTAIAVSPKDERYRPLIGQKVHLPFVQREIPIIADHHVDPSFGTGMVKITPAHDFNDYRMGLEHHLEMINIFTDDGHMNENGGPFVGLTREEAREAVVKQMKTLGLLEKVEPHLLRVGVSYRSKAVIEPYLSKQWFIKMAPFVAPLKESVEQKRVKLTPSSWESTYFHWVNHLRDWCISRQLWWGHRIPVWYHKNDPDRIICYAGTDLPPEVAQEPSLWQQDPDVLDTWFSSSLWPFSTLGWPEQTEELKKFYPTSVLVTGHDILFFWVARMILMGEYALGEPPFPETFLHGLIYGKSYYRTLPEGGVSYIFGEEKNGFDAGQPLPTAVFSKWEKLSKSKGNVIDPLDMIEEYGTDAVRMSLCSCANQSPQIDLDRRRFEEFKNFANKIWNGARFVLMHLEGLSSEAFSEGMDFSLFALEDRWILSGMNRLNKEINLHLSGYAFDLASTAAYDFFWKEFCAYYVEIVKPVLFKKRGHERERVNKQKVLLIVLLNMIRLLHPMAPFITEELFQLLKQHFPKLAKNPHVDLYTQDAIESLMSPACMRAPYPRLLREEDLSQKAEEEFAYIEKVIYTIRNIRGEMQIPPQMATDLFFVGPSALVKENLHLIQALVKTNKVEITAEKPSLGFTATGTMGELQIVIPLPQERAEKEKERLQKELERGKMNVEKLKGLLANPDFLEKARPELIEKQRTALMQGERELLSIQEKLSSLC